MNTPLRFDSSDPAAYPDIARQTLSRYPRLLEVWTLTVYENLTSEEIAERLSVHPVTVRKDRGKAHFLMREAARRRMQEEQYRREIAEEPLRFHIAVDSTTYTLEGAGLEDKRDSTQDEAFQEMSKAGSRRLCEQVHRTVAAATVLR